MLPFRSIAEVGRAADYAGPANRAAAEVVTKYIITDMYAKAVQGTPAEDAVKWATGGRVGGGLSVGGQAPGSSLSACTCR